MRPFTRLPGLATAVLLLGLDPAAWSLAATPDGGLRPPPVPAATRVAQRLERDLEWYRRNLVAAYDAGGRRDPRWDVDARLALTLAATMWGRDPQRQGNEAERAWQASHRAVTAGCRDGAVLYVHATTYGMTALETTAEAARLHREAATALDGAVSAGRHAPALAALAHLRAAEALIDDATARGDVRPRGIPEQLDAATALATAVGEDRHLPHALAVGLVEGLLDAGHRLGADRREDFEPLLAALTAGRPAEDALPSLLRAAFHLGYAWDARGGGFAPTVTDNGFAVFADRVKAAESELARAVALDPLSPAIAPLMMTVELALGRGRPAMEAWFGYGLAVDPGSFSLFSSKLHYLEPRWHGSAQEMLDFGRQALAGQAWSVYAPFSLVLAHATLANDLDDPATYWAGNASACADVRAVYEPYLERYPDAAYERSGFATLLYQCGDFRAAHRELERLGDDARIGPSLTRARFEHQRLDAATRAGAAGEVKP